MSPAASGTPSRLGLDEPVRDRKPCCRAELRLELRGPCLEMPDVTDEPRPASLGEGRLAVVPSRHGHVFHALAHEQVLELGVLLEVHAPASELHVVERRNGDVDVSTLVELRHRPVQKREDERADVRTVHVCVRHDDDPAVAEVRDVELVAEPGADRGDHRLDLRVRQDLVDAVLLGVDDLSAQREDRLRHAIAGLLRGASRGVALDDEELGRFGVLDRAVRELSRERSVLERALAARELTRLPRGLPRVPGRDRLLDDLPGLGADSPRGTPRAAG